MNSKFVIIVMAIVLAISVAFSCFLIISLKEAKDANVNAGNNNLGNNADTTTTSDGDNNTGDNSGNTGNNPGNDNSRLEKAPDFTVYDLKGNEVKLSDYFGKPIVLNFWATWCGQCEEEMPEFDEVYKQYEGKVTFLMVNATASSGETAEKAMAYIYSNSDFTLPFFLDVAGEAQKAYGFSALPFSFFINEDGYIVSSVNAKINKVRLLSEIERIYTP